MGGDSAFALKDTHVILLRLQICLDPINKFYCQFHGKQNRDTQREDKNTVYFSLNQSVKELTWLSRERKRDVREMYPNLHTSRPTLIAGNQ